MNKKDVLIMVALMALLFLWGPIDRNFIKPVFFPDSPTPETVEADPPATPTPAPAPLPTEPAVPPASVDDETIALATPATDVTEIAPRETEQDRAEFDRADPVMPTVEEETLSINTELMEVIFSSRGATIREIVFHDYPRYNEPDSPPVTMDFGAITALGIQWLEHPGLVQDFELSRIPGEEGVRFSRALTPDIRLDREIRIVDEYRFHVRDTFSNQSSQPMTVAAYTLRTGRMEPVPGVSSTYGMFPLGVDTLLPDGGVKRWGRELNNNWAPNAQSDISRQPLRTAVDWIAVKNKYFVQSLRPHVPETDNAFVYLATEGPRRELVATWGSLQYAPLTLAAGRAETREITFYAGPQKISRLKALGYHQDQVMELGWRPIRFFAGVLMVGLSAIYSVTGNYGVAIMLLTVIIRIFFWPLTHKGTESMRRMQEIAPLMKEMNEKHKDNPQKRQQAMMELYKEHKVNPLGGCLPMLVQIPVFIGLFYLLRTAIELRYASFLWISDLSEPEGILADVLPLPLNILPIFMAVTMYFQQKLTPMASTGDEKQVQMQKMMMRVMPVMMLVLLYNFAAGLALYWSTQNVLMIIQQALYRRRRARQQALSA